MNVIHFLAPWEPLFIDGVLAVSAAWVLFVFVWICVGIYKDHRRERDMQKNPLYLAWVDAKAETRKASARLTDAINNARERERRRK